MEVKEGIKLMKLGSENTTEDLDKWLDNMHLAYGHTSGIKQIQKDESGKEAAYATTHWKQEEDHESEYEYFQF